MTTNAHMEQTTQGNPEEASEHPDTAGENLVDWSAMDAEPDIIEGDTEVLDEPPAAVVEDDDGQDAVTPVVAAPATPAEVVTPPAAAEEAPVEIPKPAAPAFDMKKWEEDSVAQLQELYKLSEEDARSLLTEPETVLPKMLAKAHMQMTKSVLESVKGVLPNVMETTQAAEKAETEARNAFFSVNKDLAKAEYEEAIIEAGKVYRKLNPNSPREEAVRRIGEMVRINLGLPLMSEQLAASAAATPAVTAPKPFTPARGNTGGQAPAKKGVWESLAAEFEDES